MVLSGLYRTAEERDNHEFRGKANIYSWPTDTYGCLIALLLQYLGGSISGDGSKYTIKTMRVWLAS